MIEEQPQSSPTFGEMLLRHAGNAVGLPEDWTSPRIACAGLRVGLMV